jgi:hypothetical protein
MQSGSGFLLIVVGLLLLYVVISGKMGLFENFIYQLFGLSTPGNFSGAGAGGTWDEQKPAVKPAAGATTTQLPYGLQLPTLGAPGGVFSL